MTTVTELQHRIRKTRQYLHRLETEIHRAKYRRPVRKKAEEQRIARLAREFKKKYPYLEADSSILKLVGTEPHNPPSKDKEVNRRIMAERYG